MIHDSRYVHFEELVEVCLRHLRLQGERSFASTGASTSKCNPADLHGIFFLFHGVPKI